METNNTYYTWIAKSNDESFTDCGVKKTAMSSKPMGIFVNQKNCYNSMRDAVLVKMKWNSEWEDVNCDDSCVGYEVEFTPDYIKHTSYSGTYLYKIVECDKDGVVSDGEWRKLDEELGIKPKVEIKTENEIQFFAEKFVHGRYSNDELEEQLSDFIGKKVEVHEVTDNVVNGYDYMLTCHIYGDDDALGYYLDLDLYYLPMRDGEHMYITEVNVEQY